MSRLRALLYYVTAFVVAFVLFFSIITFARSAHGADIPVAPGGSLRDALRTARPGDRVLLRAGVYPSVGTIWLFGAAELTMELRAGYAVSSVCFGGSRESSQEDFSSVYIDPGAPSTVILLPRHSPESAGIVPVFARVSPVLSVGSETHVAAGVVQPVEVTMIDLDAVWCIENEPVHEHCKASAFALDLTDRVPRVHSAKRVPFERRDALEVTVVHCDNQAVAECDIFHRLLPSQEVCEPRGRDALTSPTAPMSRVARNEWSQV